MSSVFPTHRRYDSSGRRERAVQRREAMLVAARKLFGERGFAATTIEAIAADANCAPTSVYAVFKSKAGVLAALIEHGPFGDAYHDTVASMAFAARPADRLRIAARIARLIYEAEHGLFVGTGGAGLVSPEIATQEQALEQRRFERQRPLVEWLQEQGALKANLSTDRAHERLWALTSRELYHNLVDIKRWTADDYETWLADLIVSDLLE